MGKTENKVKEEERLRDGQKVELKIVRSEEFISLKLLTSTG